MANTQKFAPRLSKNNIDLSQILSDINNLPPAGTEDISTELDAQTEAINSLLSMVNRKVAENNGEGRYVWKKMTAKDGNVLDYIVSSNESAYPDNGEQDGYWYKRMNEGVNAEDLGFTKMAVDTFTVASTQTFGNVTVSHNLGEIPKLIIISTLDEVTNSTNNYHLKQLIVMKNPTKTTNHKWQGYFMRNGDEQTIGTDFATAADSGYLNSTGFKIYYNSCYYVAGKEYVVTTFA